MDDRRQFFAKIFGVLVGLQAVFKSRTAFAKKLGLALDKVPTLSKVGGSAAVKLDGKEILIIRDGETSVRALSAKCTHQNCNVNYNAGSKKILCKCHGSAFDLTGKVLTGPATVALKNYPATIADGKIILTVS